VDITVRLLAEPEELKGRLMVVFADVAESPKAEAPDRTRRASVRGVREATLEQELRQAREELRTFREEIQTSQEELKSANEELQSTNEELQSSNEELTTSKEEMQSMNEELQTVNHELQAKVSDLSRANNDMKNLLDSTDIVTLFLDGDLNVRRFTSQISKIIKLIPGDAGRPITDIASKLEYPKLVEDVREVLRTLVFKETLVAGSGERWFLVRIMPYRTLENRIDGVVITFTDVTVSKALEMDLRKTQAELERLITDKTAELDKARKDLRE
jgi:transcriptional regulator with PAS, ATPase and Fis domain